MHNGIHRQSTLRDKLKSSICCFTGTVHHDPLDHGDLYYNKLSIPRTPTTPISPGSWLKKSPTSCSEFGDPPRVRGRSSIMSRRGRKHHHRQSQSADFSYDPSSYALNFENESPEEFPFRNFSSRLPASPPSTTPPMKYSEELPVTAVPKEIVGYS